MKHFCHWPGCTYSLPVGLRRLIWATYRPGQEITKDPSPEYIAAARDVREWVLKKEAGADAR